jgi:predicted glycosyltransferase
LPGTRFVVPKREWVVKIWFDADNAPHVLIMRPLARELSDRGHEIRFTARDRTSTCELLDLYGLPYLRVGGSYRSGKIGKVVGTLERARSLVGKIRDWKPDVSFGHGSRALPPASWYLKVPSITMYDHEWVNPTLFNLFCARILLPDVIDAERCREAGIRAEKVGFFPGLKEELYLTHMAIDPEVSESLGLDEQRIRVLLRPPARLAHYHNPEAERIMAELLRFLGPRGDVQVVLLPRDGDEEPPSLPTGGAQVIVPQRVYDGPSLIAAMDIVIGGGGTMTREAAVLGVPSYSFFRGKNGRVDQMLESHGKLVMLRSPADVAEKLVVTQRPSRDVARPESSPCEFIADEILAVAGGKRIRCTASA